MTDEQPWQESGEELKSSAAPAPSCADRPVARDTHGHVTGAGTSGAKASLDGGVSAGRAAPGRSERILFANENLFIARRRDPVQLVLAGEFDFSSLPHLTAALSEAADGSGVLHVDMSGVYFCDLAALRTIIGLARHSEDQQPLGQSRSVALHNVPVHVEGMIRILGWDTTPGLTTDTGTTDAPQRRQ